MTNFYIIIGVFIALGMSVLLWNIFTSWYLRKHSAKDPYIVFQVIPSAQNEKTPSVAEHMFSIVHGIFQELSFFEKCIGKEQISSAFEIVKIRGKINLYFRIRQSQSSFFIAQVYAHYPEAEIEQVKDYCQLEKARVEWRDISTKNSSLWPIKRFSQFENIASNTFHDPLSGMLQSLGEMVEHNELAGIQITFRPFDDELFRENAKKALSISLGRNLDMLKNTFEEVYLTFGFWKTLFVFPKKCFLLLVTRKTSDSLEGKEIQTDGETKQSHERENIASSANDKMSRIVFESSIRVFHAVSSTKNTPLHTSSQIAGFKVFALPYLNEFGASKKSNDSHALQSLWSSAVTNDSKMILSAEELATLIHLPHESVENADVHWVSSRKISAPHELPLSDEPNVTLLGKSNYRGQKKEFGIRPDDRRRHVYIAGKTGMGKSTLLENMIYSDINSGKGVAVVDPHGDLADAVLEFVPKNRTNDVIWFDPSDTRFPISFNILECPNPEHRHLVTSGVVGVFKKMFGDSWGPRLEHILRNTLLALIEAEGQSLLGVLRILTDKKYRSDILKKVKDPVVLQFWNDEFGAWQPRQVAEAISPIQNKVGQFLSSSLVRNILGQTKSSFSLRFAMDTKKIMIINLSKGKIGEDVSALLGAMMITKFQLDVMSRSDIREKDREDFYLYVDEFQNFATQSFATILSEARKYKLNLTVANQYLAQMEEEVRDAVFGNVGTLITFQVGFDDAKTLSDQFGGEDFIEPVDIGSLPKYQTYLRLMIDGMPSRVFSSLTLPPPSHLRDEDQIQKIQSFSRERYAKPRSKVEERIIKWSQA